MQPGLQHSTVVFQIGFRPFFLGAAVYAVVAMALSTSHFALGLKLIPGQTIPPTLWHGHELLFGFAVAVIAGFVLTASQNWTGLKAASSQELMVLFGVWLAGRIAFLAAGVVPLAVASVIDLLFLPLLAAVMARILIRARNRRNAVFPPLLLALAGFNACLHAQLHGLADLAWFGLAGTTALLTFLLVFMGGRVIPFFTQNRLVGTPVHRWPALDWAATLSVVPIPLWFALDVVWLTVAGLLLPAALIAARLLAWSPWATRHEPMLWILHLGYAWIPVGLTLWAAHEAGLGVSFAAGQHALLAGALGALTLGMMARVALGHTGRTMMAPQWMAPAFALVLLAGLVRVAAELIPEMMVPLWLVAGGLWVLAFGVYVVVYSPILTQPRADGVPG